MASASLAIRLLAVAAACSVAARAGLVTQASASWSGQYCASGFDPLTGCSEPVTAVGDSLTVTGTNAATASVTGAHATGLASYGSVNAEAYANSGGTRYTRVSSASSSASAGFSDTLTITGPSGDGFLRATVYWECCRFDEGAGSGVFRVGSSMFSIGTFNGAQSAVITAPFSFGAPLNISASATAEAIDFAPNDPNSGAEDGYARMYLQKVVILDQNSQPLAGYFYSSASGAAYPLEGAVPDPASWILTLTSLLAVCAMRLVRTAR